MRCDFCDEPAVVHLTNVDAATGRKTEMHACLAHAGGAGLGANTVQEMTRRMASTRRAMDAMQAFVATERRVPSLDELRAMGMVGTLLPSDAADPMFQLNLTQLRAMAQMILDEPPQPPEPQ